MQQIQRVTVFCASSTKSDKAFLQSAYNLGCILAINKIAVVYGGGSVGSMGALANGTLYNKGHITGVIPQFMMELEWGNPLVSEMIVTETMAERKKILLQMADAVVILPGGSGTLDELADTMANKKLGLYTKPIILVNQNHFFNPFLEFFDKMVEEKFMLSAHKQMFSVVKTEVEVLQAIANAPKWENIAMDFVAF